MRKGWLPALITAVLLLSPPVSSAYYSDGWDDSGEAYYVPEESDSIAYYQTNNNYPVQEYYEDAYYDGEEMVDRSEPQYLADSRKSSKGGGGSYYSRLPSHIAAPGEKVIIIDPRRHVWGAYSPSGHLLRAGLTTAGSSWCRDIRRSCRTKVGTFRIYSLGDSSCRSRKYPLPRGGAPMPYCMFFNGGQGIHGSNDLAEANLSHGCVRVSVSDAAWIRFNFATRGTKVIVRPY